MTVLILIWGALGAGVCIDQVQRRLGRAFCPWCLRTVIRHQPWCLCRKRLIWKRRKW
jgi:hypothetical protein